jgi:MoaA/NifB/PqqE/SkfB family radical SAM enzyme
MTVPPGDLAPPDNTWLSDYIDQGKAGQLVAPPFASWIVTRACNLSCYYCFADARKRDPDELTTAEAKAVIDDLAGNGVFCITYMGGEPLMRKDIFDLIDYSTDLGIYAAILTNGLLVKADTVPRLAAAGCQLLGVSVDSNDPLIHDRVRGATGSLVGAKRAVRAAVRADMRCSVRIVVTEDSLPALGGLFSWAVDEGVEELIIIPIFMVGRAAGTPDDRRADIRGKQLFFDGLARLRELAEPLGLSVPHEDLACCVGIELSPPDAEHHHVGHAVGFEKTVGCKVGRFVVNIQPNGDVYSCPFVHYPIGSLRTQSITEVWQHPLLRQSLTEDLGCHARSIIHTGRPDVADPTYGRSTGQLLAELGDEPPAARPGRTFVSLEQLTTPR